MRLMAYFSLLAVLSGCALPQISTLAVPGPLHLAVPHPHAEIDLSKLWSKRGYVPNVDAKPSHAPCNLEAWRVGFVHAYAYRWDMLVDTNKMIASIAMNSHDRGSVLRAKRERAALAHKDIDMSRLPDALRYIHYDPNPQVVDLTGSSCDTQSFDMGQSDGDGAAVAGFEAAHLAWGN
ncbi:MAG: hypothetical protein M0037_07990 [Betaproteobacteria bacterium]|nr:hypothetical protein [Betaproteobacteria bacterium]